MKIIFTLIIVSTLCLGASARTTGTTNTTPSVKLSSFTANMNIHTGKVDLRWTSANETDLNYYMLERSIDGINFKDAAMIFANGNNASDYAFPDNISLVKSANVYYRLRSVNNAGEQNTCSEIRNVRIAKTSVTTLTIRNNSNEGTDEFLVTIPAAWKQKKVNFEIFDAQGQSVRTFETSGSSQTETISTKDLRAGTLIIEANCNGKTASQKIIKQ